MDRLTDKNFLESVSSLCRTVRVVVIIANFLLMCFILISLNYNVILCFQVLDQEKYSLFYYNLPLIIVRLTYLVAVYCGFFGSFRCSARYLTKYLVYSIITIALILVFALYWFALAKDANQVQFGRRRFEQYLEVYHNSSDNCTKSTVGYRRLNRFLKDYKCCDWDSSVGITSVESTLSANQTNWITERNECVRNSFETCRSNSTIEFCVDRLNRISWISYFHLLLYISVFALFFSNLFAVYLRRELIAHRIRNKDQKTYQTVF